MNAFSGLNVLLLRSARSRDSLASSLMQAGALVHRLPVLAIEPIVFNAADAIPFDTFIDVNKVVFISRHAVEHGMEWLRLAKVDLRNTTVFAVGSVTAAMLIDRGIVALYPKQQASSEGVLAMSAMASVEGQRILIVRGEGGRALLKDSLSDRGAQVAYLEAYRRVPDFSHVEDIRAVVCGEAPVVAMLHSGETAKAYAGLLNSMPDQVWNIPCVVPGARVAKLAREEGFNRVLVARSAMDSDMEQAVRYWYTSATN